VDILVNLLVAAVILGLTYALASEGLWGACLMFFNVLFGALIAFNFYEPLAKLIADNASILAGFADMVCLLLLFVVTVFILRLTTETLAPAMVRFPTPLYHLGRWFFALACSLVTVAIVLLGLDCAPVHKKIFGVIDYKQKVPFGLGLERQWLAFFQQTTGQIFVSHAPTTRDPFGEYRDAQVFDPRGEWLLIHQEARPFGIESVLEDGGAGAAPEAGAGGGGAAPGGGPAPGAPGAPPGQANANPGDPKVVGPAVGGGVVLPQ
jgi:hypothetical protein